MHSRTFKALVVRESPEGQFVRQVEERGLNDLPAGEVLIAVRYSSLNYKDALSAIGNPGVTKSYPHTPGIDAAGVVVDSASDAFRPGDEVIVTGYDLGMNTAGGFSEYIRVPAGWIVPRPESLSLRECMLYGTAGFTAAMSVYRLERYGVTPDQGDILVTGATGGVGSLAVAILALEGYRVVAGTGKPDQAPYLQALGAADVVHRNELLDPSGRALLRGRWAGAVDTVGGEFLATAIKSTRYRGAVTTCGNVASDKLQLTVYPFILRGISLLGIDSANCPMPMRLELWQKLAHEWRLPQLERIASECTLAELDGKIEAILSGQQRGRVVVKVAG